MGESVASYNSTIWQHTITKKMVAGMSKNLHKARSSLSNIVGFGGSTDDPR